MKNWLANLVGTFLATFAFWVVGAAIANHTPVEDLAQKIGIILTDRAQDPGLVANTAINILQEKGLAISANDYLSELTGFYGNIIQISFAAFVLLGAASFFAVRWQSIIAAEDTVISKIESKLESNEFNADIEKRVSSAVDIAIEPYQDRINNIVAPNNDVLRRLKMIEKRIANLSSEDEPDDEGRSQR